MATGLDLAREPTIDGPSAWLGLGPADGLGCFFSERGSPAWPWHDSAPAMVCGRGGQPDHPGTDGGKALERQTHEQGDDAVTPFCSTERCEAHHTRLTTNAVSATTRTAVTCTGKVGMRSTLV
jgi:hypothetical protein